MSQDGSFVVTSHWGRQRPRCLGVEVSHEGGSDDNDIDFDSIYEKNYQRLVTQY